MKLCIFPHPAVTVVYVARVYVYIRHLGEDCESFLEATVSNRVFKCVFVLAFFHTLPLTAIVTLVYPQPITVRTVVVVHCRYPTLGDLASTLPYLL